MFLANDETFINVDDLDAVKKSEINQFSVLVF